MKSKESMKRSHIIGLVVIAVGLGVVLTTTMSAGSTAAFDQALASEGQSFTISGTLVLDKPIEYNPDVDPNLTTFYMMDQDSNICKVFLNQPIPTDFERAESVTIKGKGKNGEFYATDILLKCPSKYQDQA